MLTNGEEFIGMAHAEDQYTVTFVSVLGVEKIYTEVTWEPVRWKIIEQAKMRWVNRSHILYRDIVDEVFMVGAEYDSLEELPQILYDVYLTHTPE